MSDISETVKDWVAGVLGPGVAVEYGRFPEAPVACEVKSSPGDPWVKRYQSGGGVKRYAYEVYIRVNPRGGEARRFDALAALRSLQARIESREVPDIGAACFSHEVTQLPNEHSTEKDGRAVYQMTAALTYHEKGN